MWCICSNSTGIYDCSVFEQLPGAHALVGVPAGDGLVGGAGHHTQVRRPQHLQNSALMSLQHIVILAVAENIPQN